MQGKNCRYNHVKEVGGAGGGVTAQRSEARSKAHVVPPPVNLPSRASCEQHVTFSPSRKMVTLRDDPSRNPKKWVMAAEFIPGKIFGPPASVSTNHMAEDGGVVPGSYSRALGGEGVASYLDVISAEEASSLLCPFAEMGHCPFEVCEYLHGDICDTCNKQCLNPFDQEQQKSHRKECMEMHEREMEKAFQFQESEGKHCAICMECVVNKMNKSDRRFGILADCEHCFCLNCIRKWRGSTKANKTIRACPICRVVSFYVIPSEVWIDDEKQKMKLLKEYKDNLGKKHCKYFSMGEGTCPFGTSCFYKHEYPDGRKAEETPRFCEGAEGDWKTVKTSTLWDFLNSREEETLESLPQVSSPGDATTTPFQDLLNQRQEEVWLNYEPNIDDLEFL